MSDQTEEQQEQKQELGTTEKSASPNQPREPKPKRASRARKSNAVAEAGAVIRDPNLYAEMSRPFATQEEANAALTAFLIAVRSLREKHRIADVVTVVCVRAADVGNVITWGQNGDATMATPMLAYALGSSEASDRRLVERMRERGAGGAT